LQDLNHVFIMKPITKCATTVPHTQRIPEIISMAFREAYNGRPERDAL
jgi:acetolactate synthase I/II/III large subunit